MSPRQVQCPTGRAPAARRDLWTVFSSAILVLAAAAPLQSADGPPKAPIAIDHGLQQPLADAQSLIARGRFREAIQSLQPILTAPQAKLALAGGRYLDAKLAANRLIAGLPADARAGYERDFGDFARRELEHARSTGRIQDFLAVAEAFRHTTAGRQALLAAAGLFLDSGRFLEATSVARDLLDGPGCSATEESLAAARLLIAWLELGRVEQARRWVQSRKEFLARRGIEVDGKWQSLDEWLETLVRQRGARPAASTRTVTGGYAQRVSAGPFDRPSETPVWTRRVGGRSSRSVLEEAVARRAESGIEPVIQCVPLVVGETIVIRESDELAAYDLQTGEKRWSHELSPTGTSFENGTFLDNESNFSQMRAEAIADHSLSARAPTAISSDGTRVFTVVEEVAAYGESSFSRRGRRGRWAVEPPPKTSLAAYDLRDGKRQWRISEIKSTGLLSTEEDVTKETNFLGPPLVLGGTLYVLGHTEEGACLLALDPVDGSLRWRHSLAGFAGFEADAASATGPACVPVETSGLLICPTPEGIVIALDLVTRSCRWAYRLPPIEEPPRMPRRWGRAFTGRETGWISNWRENLVRIDGERCFVVSSRSASIHALSTATGELLWTRPVQSGLFLGPVIDGRLLAVARYGMSAFDAASGKLLWTTATGLAGGRGFVSAGRYWLPQSKGGLAAIDIRSGSATFPIDPVTPALGNLLPITPGGEWACISFSFDHLALLPSLSKVREAAARSVRQHPDDGEATLRLARLDREAGDFGRAEQRLAPLAEPIAPDPARPTAQGTGGAASRRPDPQKDAHAAQRLAARAQLFYTLLEDVGRTNGGRQTLESQLDRAAAGDDQRVVALQALVAARLRSGRRIAAIEGLFELAGLDVPGHKEVEKDPLRSVGFDRSLRACLEDVLPRCTEDERRQVDSRLERLIESALEKEDAATLRRVLRRLRYVGSNPSLRDGIESALRPDLGPLQLQLEFWDAAASGDRRRAPLAWRNLAELFRSRGDQRMAVECYRRLSADFPDVRFEDGLRAADLLAAAKVDRAFARELAATGVDPWPAKKPDVVSEARAGAGAGFFELPVEIVPGSLCEKLDVLDRDGQTLRFQGAGQSTYWDLGLPTENSPFRGYYFLHRGWSVGTLLIVQIGTDLFGITPLDEEGNTEPKIVWHVELVSAGAVGGVDVPVPFGPRGLGGLSARAWLTDHLGRAVARVGPVCPACICYYDRGTLTALDPATGTLLWRRRNVPPSDLSDWDDNAVALLDRRSQRLVALRAIDGEKIDERIVGSDVRWLEGRDAIVVASQGQGDRVSRVDLAAGREKWSREFPPGTQFVRLDSRHYAAADPEGTLTVLAASSGGAKASQKIPHGDHSLQVYSAGDESRFYLAFSKPFADPDNDRANRQRDESRNPLVNGALCAVDRATGRILWTRRFEDGVFSIDQSRVAPVLVFAYRQVNSDDGWGPWPMLHCIDKRTGENVYFSRITSAVQSPSRPFAEVDVQRREVILSFPDLDVRLRYAR